MQIVHLAAAQFESSGSILQSAIFILLLVFHQELAKALFCIIKNRGLKRKKENVHSTVSKNHVRNVSFQMDDIAPPQLLERNSSMTVLVDEAEYNHRHPTSRTQKVKTQFSDGLYGSDTELSLSDLLLKINNEENQKKNHHVTKTNGIVNKDEEVQQDDSVWPRTSGGSTITLETAESSIKLDDLHDSVPSITSSSQKSSQSQPRTTTSNWKGVSATSTTASSISLQVRQKMLQSQRSHPRSSIAKGHRRISSYSSVPLTYSQEPKDRCDLKLDEIRPSDQAILKRFSQSNGSINFTAS